MAQVVSRELIDRKADIAVAAMTINFARYYSILILLELQTNHRRIFNNHGEGPFYFGLLLVESAYLCFHT